MALDQPKGWISLVLGLILLVLGVLPLLAKLGIFGGVNPIAFVTNILTANILQYIVAAAGLVLIIDAFMEMDALRTWTLVIGLIVLALGLIPVLSSFGIIGFTIPFLTALIYQLIFVIEGVLLIIAAFAMM